MKKKLIILIIILNVVLYTDSYSQVTISPEIGVSYLPFKYNNFPVYHSKRLDFFLGVGAKFPIYKKWYFETRISFVNREDVKWKNSDGWNPSYEYTMLTHDDLNIDMNILRKIGRVSIGIGGSIIRKLNNEAYRYYSDVGKLPGPTQTYIYGMNLRITYKLNKIDLNVEYMRKFDYHVRGENRYNLTISYPLLLGKVK